MAIQQRSLEVEEKDRIAFHKDNMLRVAQMILDTLDNITAYVMQYSDLFLGKETHMYCHVMDDLKYGLWVNLRKNARMKFVDFAPIRVTTELALKGMNLAAIAMRFNTMF